MKFCVPITDNQNCGGKNTNGIFNGEGQRKDGNHDDDNKGIYISAGDKRFQVKSGCKTPVREQT